MTSGADRAGGEVRSAAGGRTRSQLGRASRCRRERTTRSPGDDENGRSRDPAGRTAAERSQARGGALDESARPPLAREPETEAAGGAQPTHRRVQQHLRGMGADELAEGQA